MTESYVFDDEHWLLFETKRGPCLVRADASEFDVVDAILRGACSVYSEKGVHPTAVETTPRSLQALSDHVARMATNLEEVHVSWPLRMATMVGVIEVRGAR